jgi:hypothetical protein
VGVVCFSAQTGADTCSPESLDDFGVSMATCVAEQWSSGLCAGLDAAVAECGVPASCAPFGDSSCEQLAFAPNDVMGLATYATAFGATEGLSLEPGATLISVVDPAGSVPLQTTASAPCLVSGSCHST